ncbi:hypothetical protein FHS59_000111 [Algoriphagus iocasae]|uniref:RteC protein n=1 Tax=Algoriphagus iocasae TaxID=1836499 RepID=A0A841MJS0_9BACT|nr:RteC domain-containing protein [Algoriphagus iocasae]MBB6324496.1 hypothetical protein [Algoriphagus iocasae]
MKQAEHWNNMFREMKSEIHTATVDLQDQLQVAEQSFLIIDRYFREVKSKQEWKDEAEEIHFYKEIRPRFEAELIYYGEVYFILSTMPLGTKDSLHHLQTQYAPIRLYIQRHQLLRDYFRLGRKDMDALLFTTSKASVPYFICQIPSSGDVDATPAGKVLARFKAYDMLRRFLDREIKKIENPPQETDRNVRWTAPKAALVELAYALKAAGAVNHGNVTIRDIANHLERVFHQDLSQFYRTFQEIRIRKNSRTTFLDRLRDKLEKWMDNTDFDGKGDS